jgi:hypothetical protein
MGFLIKAVYVDSTVRVCVGENACGLDFWVLRYIQGGAKAESPRVYVSSEACGVLCTGCLEECHVMIARYEINRIRQILRRYIGVRQP